MDKTSTTQMFWFSRLVNSLFSLRSMFQHTALHTFSAWNLYTFFLQEQASAICFYEIQCCISKFVLFVSNLKWIEYFAFFKFLDGDTLNISTRCFSLLFAKKGTLPENQKHRTFLHSSCRAFQLWILFIKHYCLNEFIDLMKKIIWVKNLWYFIFYSGVF